MTKFYKFFAVVAFLSAVLVLLRNQILFRKALKDLYLEYSEFPEPYTVYTSASDRWGICGNTLL